MSKANARDWHESQLAAQQDAESLEEQRILLRYAAQKRKTNYPSVHELRRLGYGEAAETLARAYAQITEAHNQLEEALHDD